MVAEHGVCPAAIDTTYDGINSGTCGGRFCWAVAGTFCDGGIQGTFAQKRGACLKCHFYHRVRAEEGTANLRTKFMRLVFSRADVPLLHEMTTRAVAAGERLFNQGEPADKAFIIQQGSSLLIVEKNGQLHPTDHRSEGDLVGMTSVLTGEPRQAHAEAETDMDVWCLTREQLDNLFQQDPDLRDFLTELVAERFDSRRPVADRTIGAYMATDIIGRGGFSIVYKGAHIDSGTPVAIKMMRHDMAMNPDFIQNFRNEARIIAGLDHANIIKLYDIEEKFRTLFLITEHLEGEALETQLQKRHRLSADVAAGYLHQICCGLQYAHAKGIVHRDINATNVIVLPDDNLKILDFGLACPIGTEDFDFGGSVFYMSPEQIEGNPLDQRTDIYSLGILAYEMVVGRRPFPEDDLRLLMKMHCDREIPDPREAIPDLPSEMAELILKACRRDAQERFQSVDTMIGIVASLAGGAFPPRSKQGRETDWTPHVKR
jgi:tRNA A-37 threonylcarbamoyl transferase component Bud32